MTKDKPVVKPLATPEGSGPPPWSRNPGSSLPTTSSLSSEFVASPSRRRRPLGAIALTVAVIAGSPVSHADAATSDHMMCNYKAAQRTQTVSIDPYLAACRRYLRRGASPRSRPGTNLFDRVPRLPDLRPLLRRLAGRRHSPHCPGLATQTWVNTVCNPGYAQRGNNKAIVFLGANDAWRNKTMLSHELGHALGFADHGAADASTGHIGYKPCGNYIGVMSYCTSPQSWFLDFNRRRLPRRRPAHPRLLAAVTCTLTCSMSTA